MSDAEPSSNGSPEVVFEVDADGVFVAVYGPVEMVTGYTREQLLGRHHHVLVDPVQAGFATRQFESKRRDRSLVTNYQVTIERANGSIALLAVSSCRIDQPGEPIRMRGVARELRNDRPVG